MTNAESVKRYQENRDAIMLRPDKDTGATIRAAAAAAGKSVQGYVLEAIREKMERERAGAVPAVSPEDTGAGGTPVPGGGSGFPAHSQDDISIGRSSSLPAPQFPHWT